MAGWVDLYWLPLGSGGRFVAFNGRVYERLLAWRQRRTRQDLYHAALMVGHGDDVYAVEMGPVWNVVDRDRGVLFEGPVGSTRLGRFRAFRYEVRCWPGGRIPDAADAVASPVRVSDEVQRAAFVIAALHEAPALVWGRDESKAGEMWNSNSLVAWALARTGHPMEAIRPPAGGRAPGWQAGVVVAERHGQAL